jgi:hypothetical protein
VMTKLSKLRPAQDGSIARHFFALVGHILSVATQLWP